MLLHEPLDEFGGILKFKLLSKFSIDSSPLRHVIIGRPLREGPHIRTLSLGVGGGVRNPIHSENQPETFLFRTPSPSGVGGGAECWALP